MATIAVLLKEKGEVRHSGLISPRGARGTPSPGDALLRRAIVPDLRMYYTKMVSCEYKCNPTSGTGPFQTDMILTVFNNCTEQARRVALEIDLTLANQTTIDNWRSGYKNLKVHQIYDDTRTTTSPPWVRSSATTTSC
jgi:hypothetical protein